MQQKCIRSGISVRHINEITLLLIVACIAITTTLHHWFPQVTGVPTYVVSIGVMLQQDITVSILAVFVFLHARSKLGAARAWIFLFSSVLFAGFEETMAILAGRYGLSPPTYYFTYGGLWFFEIPLYTCLAWFVVCYCGYIMVKHVFPSQGRPVMTAALTALFGTCWDFWLDPVVCNRHLVQASLPDLWIWLDPTGLHLFGIPILNFVGWFGVIFLIVFMFEHDLAGSRDVTTRIVARYYVYLAIAWGGWALALHFVGTAALFETFDIVPVILGSRVDSASIPLVVNTCFAIYLGCFLFFIAYDFYKYWKSSSRAIVNAFPMLAIALWLMAVLNTAVLIIVTFPASTLPWIMLGASIYPVVLMAKYLVTPVATTSSNENVTIRANENKNP